MADNHHQQSADSPTPSQHEDDQPDPLLTSTKAQKIRDACRNSDIPSLVGLATSDGGLLHDQLRCQACMYLSILLPIWDPLNPLEGYPITITRLLPSIIVSQCYGTMADLVLQ
jgi:hypothetical protein